MAEREKKELVSFLRRTQKRLFLVDFIQIFFWYLTAGLGLGLLVNSISLFVPLYGAERLAAAGLGIVCLVGVVYSIFRFPGKEKAAAALDKKGLKERVSTAWEQRNEDTVLGNLQRKDTLEKLNRFSLKESFPVKPFLKRYLWLLPLFALMTATAVLPSAARTEALARHELKEEAKKTAEKAERLKQLIDTEPALKELLKADAGAELKRQLDASIKELSKASDEKSLQKAKNRMETKIAQSLEGVDSKRLGGQAAALLSEYMPELMPKRQELAGNLPNNNMPNNGSQGSKGQSGGADSQKGNGEVSENANESSVENQNGNSQDGENSGNGGSPNENSAGENGSDNGKNGNNGNGTGENGSGNEKNGNGTGENGSNSGQNGTGGKGTGSGKTGGQGGKGTGGGQNYGSSHGIEKIEKSNRGEPEQIMIGSRQTGNDANLTGSGTKGSSSSQKGTLSDGFRGEAVDYGKVLGSYSQAAYDRLESGRIPEGMEAIVKSYFDGLNE